LQVIGGENVKRNQFSGERIRKEEHCFSQRDIWFEKEDEVEKRLDHMEKWRLLPIPLRRVFYRKGRKRTSPF
jgi:hypothetical protein